MAQIRRTANKKLGELLVKRKLISREQAHEALEEHETTGEPFGEMLVKKSDMTETDIAEAIA